MKFKISVLFCFLIFFLVSSSQEEPYLLKFNRIDYFSPPSNFSVSESKTLYNYTEIVIDLNQKIISINTNYEDGPIKSSYQIGKMSELLSSPNEGEYYRFQCTASNYSEVIIEVNKNSDWVKRIVTHNNITHKYYIVL